MTEFAKSVNLERNHLPSIKIPSARTKYEGQNSGSTIMSTNAARIQAEMRLAKAQAKMNDNVFSSLKNSRERLHEVARNINPAINQYSQETPPA